MTLARQRSEGLKLQGLLQACCLGLKQDAERILHMILHDERLFILKVCGAEYPSRSMRADAQRPHNCWDARVERLCDLVWQQVKSIVKETWWTRPAAMH